MRPNPVLRKLGFSDTDRLVILHCDDIGMCHASLAAYADLVDFGLVSSAATMVPCPWFPQAAAFCRARPELDMGVHITFNSEWDGFRWGPVSTREPASGLLDEEGYFHRWQDAVQAQATPAAARAEMQAQVGRALAAGIDVTHVDTHMGTVAHPKFVGSYIELALQHRIPAMIPRGEAGFYEHMGLDSATAAFFAQTIAQLEEQGIPLVDHMVGMPLDQPDDRLEIAKDLLGGLPAGVTHFILHPSADTPELRGITDDWPSRVADYRTFASEDLRRFILQAGIQVIGYRALRGLMR